MDISESIEGEWTLSCQIFFHRRTCTQRRLKQAKCNCMSLVNAFLQGHAWWPKCIWTDSCIMHVQQSVQISLNQTEMSTNCNGRLITVPCLLMCDTHNGTFFIYSVLSGLRSEVMFFISYMASHSNYFFLVCFFYYYYYFFSAYLLLCSFFTSRMKAQPSFCHCAPPSLRTYLMSVQSGLS